jgi:hypothetical protein
VAELLFEACCLFTSPLPSLTPQKHNVRGFFSAPEALLATYGSGKTTALVVDFGEHKTDIIPIFEAGTQSMLVDGNIPRCFFGILSFFL